jgi:mercuric ion transport protein
MTSADTPQAPDMVRGRMAAALGSLAGALAASSCCLLPVVLFTLGAGGAWIGTLVRLASIQPLFIAASVGCLGIGYWLVYRSHSGCADGETCRTPVADKFVKGVLALATRLVALAVGFKFLAPMLSS